jgi:peptidoglycan/LPS O-acetylase OafA/YrhL
VLLALVVLWDPREERPPPTLRLLESRALVAIGVVSYSLFLWHEPLVRFLRAHSLTLGGPGGLVGNLVVVGIVAGVLSALTYRFVEAPALRHARRTRIAAPTLHPPAAPAPGDPQPAPVAVGTPTPLNPKPS